MTLPKGIREHFGLKPGDRLDIHYCWRYHCNDSANAARRRYLFDSSILETDC